MKNRKMEEFKKALEEANFSLEFIKKSLEYFNELEEEKEIEELNNLGEVIDYFARVGSYTCNSLQSEENLKELREDLYLLYLKDSYNILKFSKYFENIEEFEIQILYVLFYDFYTEWEEDWR